MVKALLFAFGFDGVAAKAGKLTDANFASIALSEDYNTIVMCVQSFFVAGYMRPAAAAPSAPRACRRCTPLLPELGSTDSPGRTPPSRWGAAAESARRTAVPSPFLSLSPVCPHTRCVFRRH